MSSNQQARVVVVKHEESEPLSLGNSVERVNLQFAFIPGKCESGLDACWRRAGPEEMNLVADVNQATRDFAGRFTQQSLNRLFSELLYSRRPAAVVVDGLYGCTVDLSRLAALLGVPSIVILRQGDLERFNSLKDRERVWVMDGLHQANSLLIDPGSDAHVPDQLPEYLPLDMLENEVARLSVAEGAVSQGFSYANYEFCLRDHPLLTQMMQGDVWHFRESAHVLDLGCGAGVFLDLLQSRGIRGTGVERDPEVARYAAGMGLDVIQDDALAYLQKSGTRYDGIYCSHFVEHLPFDLVEKLISLLAKALDPNGILVLVFPDPESIRSQLLGFWRDPEHVRFYHPELIKALAAAYGLSCIWSSYDAQPHEVTGFSRQPPELKGRAVKTGQEGRDRDHRSLMNRMLSKLGIVSRQDHLQQITLLEEKIRSQQEMIDGLAQRTDKLWAVNQTWAWNDNVVLKFRNRITNR